MLRYTAFESEQVNGSWKYRKKDVCSRFHKGSANMLLNVGLEKWIEKGLYFVERSVAGVLFKEIAKN